MSTVFDIEVVEAADAAANQPSAITPEAPRYRPSPPTPKRPRLRWYLVAFCLALAATFGPILALRIMVAFQPAHQTTVATNPAASVDPLAPAAPAALASCPVTQIPGSTDVPQILAHLIEIRTEGLATHNPVCLNSVWEYPEDVAADLARPQHRANVSITEIDGAAPDQWSGGQAYDGKPINLAVNSDGQVIHYRTVLVQVHREWQLRYLVRL